MKKKINCFITGGAGLIGLETAKALLKKGHNVTIYDLAEKIFKEKKNIPKKIKIIYGSILDEFSLIKSMENHQYVFHMAAMLGVKYTEDNKLDCIKINCDGTKNVLEASRINKIKKIIFASSSEVYGEPEKNPINESFATQGKTVYGITKLIGEEYCKAYFQKYKLKYTILRFFNTYGPDQEKKFVITNFIYNTKKKKNLIINGHGDQIRSYLFVTDAARAIVMAGMSDKTNNNFYNIGNSNEPISIKNLALFIGKILKTKNNLIFKKNFSGSDRNKNREIFYRYSDCSKFKKIINWKPQVSLKTGMKKVYKNI